MNASAPTYIKRSPPLGVNVTVFNHLNAPVNDFEKNQNLN